MNPSLKIFLTIFCYISAVMGVVTAVLHGSAKPAQTTSAVIAGVLGVLFLFGGMALSRRPRH
ncbi:hypothetical protein LG634_01370 [Streptomyces bambusae]|uniref:hypothetical protein n=1 Tax=Streptomyces bambusae TaxID=1550616 RepID=UPI001CFE8C14|nr:hypothetical protein [Streptomyces bambusae]MCB5163501.1 hypothetical protein [Streptomyces bambusae]